MIRYVAFMIILSVAAPALKAQDWWTKTKAEAVPPDLTRMTLLVERFKTTKTESIPDQAFLDPARKDDHPLVKKTNENLSDYNRALRDEFKAYKYKYDLVSLKKAEDETLFGTDTARYILKHEVYLRKFQENGRNTHYYTYIFYFHDRATKKDYPYIYLFEEKWEEGLRKLIEYLNKL